jgi:hypothetical protein
MIAVRFSAADVTSAAPHVLAKRFSWTPVFAQGNSTLFRGITLGIRCGLGQLLATFRLPIHLPFRLPLAVLKPKRLTHLSVGSHE